MTGYFQDFNHKADGAAHSYVDAVKPKLAIVLDDLCGGSDSTLSIEAAKIADKVTVAVLPNGVGGQQCFADVARTLQRNGGEAIVHMPMEAKNTPLERGSIGVNLSTQENTQRFDNAMETLAIIKPVGFNNHTGSLATSFDDVVRPVMASAVMNHYEDVRFVLDSKTSPNSVMCEVASDFGLDCVTRDAPFLDHSRDMDDIRNALWKSVEKAEATGSAITIGHPHPETMAVIAQEWDKLQERVDLVNVSEIVELRNGGQ